MSADIVRINPKYVKECSMPDVLRQIEHSDESFMIHIKDGKWTLQVVKGTTSIFTTIGMLRCVSNHLEQMANK